jgi:hypothetical protein
MMSILPFHQLVECLHVIGLWTSSVSRSIRAAATHAGSAATSFLYRPPSTETLHPSSSDNSLPKAASPECAVPNSPHARYGSENSFTASSSRISPAIVAKSTHGSTVSVTLPSEKLSETPSTPASSAHSRGRFTRAVRNVIRMQQLAVPLGARTRPMSPTLLSPDAIHRKDAQPVPMQSSRVAGLVSKLRGLEPTQDLAAHQALVRHLQFSPNGKFLATSRFASPCQRRRDIV